jgi:hypothetical protein
METKTKTLQPVNQKSVYHSAGDAFTKLMNDEITIEKAIAAEKLLSLMCTAYGLEIKRAVVENTLFGMTNKTRIRVIELKNFDQIEIDQVNDKKETDNVRENENQ